MEISKKHTEGQEENYSLYWKILVCVALCDNSNNKSNMSYITIVKYHANKDQRQGLTMLSVGLTEQKQHPMSRCVCLQHISVQQGHLYTKITLESAVQCGKTKV